jgi:hypothetical protein
MDVAGDAEQVASIDAVGQRACPALAVEDRDRVDDGVARIAGDGVAEVVLGIEQVETSGGTAGDGSRIRRGPPQPTRAPRVARRDSARALTPTARRPPRSQFSTVASGRIDRRGKPGRRHVGVAPPQLDHEPPGQWLRMRVWLASLRAPRRAAR